LHRALSVHTTHPPTAYRLELLRNRPAQEPAVVSSAEDAQRLDAELAGLQQRVQAELLDKYNRRLYH